MHMRSTLTLSRIGVVVFAALMSACAGQDWRSWPWSDNAEPGLQASTGADTLTHWRLNGRIGVQHEDKGFSATIDWRQLGDDFDIRLSAPLNGGTMQLRGGPDGVVMVQSDGSIDQATDAERLMARHLGWTIPVDGAAFWVRGLSAPQSQVVYENRDEYDRLVDFDQDGWRISVLDRLQFEDMTLPRKMFMSHPTLKVRLVIKTWERI